jgi:hypothetical protein
MRRVNTIGVWVAVLAMAVGLAGCKDDLKPGESAAQGAARRLREQLFLPKDAQYLGSTVLPADDRVIFNYGTDLSLDELQKFLTDAAQGKEVLMKNDTGIGLSGADGRIVNYAWFKRDPDLYKFKTAFSVAISPLPKEIKKDQKIEKE